MNGKPRRKRSDGIELHLYLARRDIVRFIREQAKTNVRSVQGQIQFMLEQYVERFIGPRVEGD